MGHPVLGVGRHGGASGLHPTLRKSAKDGAPELFGLVKRGPPATAWRVGRVPDTSAGISYGVCVGVFSGAGRAGLASSMMVGGAPGFGRSVRSAAGEGWALQVAQWRERREEAR